MTKLDPATSLHFSPGSVAKAVITGYGCVSALGCGVPAFWNGLLEGRSGLRPICSFDTEGHVNAAAGEVAGYPSGGEESHLDRIGQYTLAAANEALGSAGLDLSREDRTRVGVILGSTLGGMRTGEAYLYNRKNGGVFDPRQLLHFPYFAPASRLARQLEIRGPVLSPSIACASGTQSVGLALEMIRRGQADAFLVGGAEAVCEFVVSGFNCLRATTADTLRPFDANRNGLLLGEGAAILVVESLERALGRKARTEIELAGTGLSGDAVHMTAPARDGAGAARAMRSAMTDADVAPSDIDFISTHGTGTVYNDAMEVAAIASVFGEAAGGIPANGIKGSIGHTLAAAGAFEAILCAQVLREGVIPPTVHCDDLDPLCGLDIVRGSPRRHAVQVALSTSSAFAGNNAALVLRRL